MGEVSDAQIVLAHTVVADAGYNCNSVPGDEDCNGDGGESSYAQTSYNSVVSGDTYSLNGVVWVWYDPSNEGDPEDAYWEQYGGDGASVQPLESGCP